MAAEKEMAGKGLNLAGLSEYRCFHVTRGVCIGRKWGNPLENDEFIDLSVSYIDLSIIYTVYCSLDLQPQINGLHTSVFSRRRKSIVWILGADCRDQCMDPEPVGSTNQLINWGVRVPNIVTKGQTPKGRKNYCFI